MRQLAQKLGDGWMGIIDVPAPMAIPGHVVVQNHFSLISPGTEGSTVSAARKSLIGKARERPAQAKQVLDVLIQQGPTQTYRAVKKKLDAYSPLGYSCAGVVLEVGEGVQGIKVGDKVACGGVGYANHAEVIAVPQNLCVPLPDAANLEVAAYNTLGAIAMQGIRQADLRLGETCFVIGLGLLGQLTGLMLRASGVKVIGVDLNPKVVELASKYSMDAAMLVSSPGVEDTVARITDGIGADACIITAASSSTDPINLAGRILRKKGAVVVVGDVPTGFDRNPDYYRKELSLRMSCSYGPGRYDPVYEEKGHDYPPGYVRWTQRRNMAAFQELLTKGSIDINYLTTHRFPLEESSGAYDIILGNTESYLGIIVEYEADQGAGERVLPVADKPAVAQPGNPLSIGFVGAGSYAQSQLLPNIPRGDGVVLQSVATASGITARTVADKYQFNQCSSDANDVIEDPAVGTVFVATRHDSHAAFVLGALEHNKNVFVEKPICLTEAELVEIEKLANTRESAVMVGFNRRFSPLVKQAKQTLTAGPMSMAYRINAGSIPPDSWIQDPEVGGGRLIGEVCHFIDLMMYFSGSLPVSVHALAMAEPGGCDDVLTLNLSFENGSVGSICYFANGPKALPKERLEVYQGGLAAILEDFKTLAIYRGGKVQRKRLLNQDKGQQNMVAEFCKSLSGNTVAPISFGEIYACTLATFKAVESIKSGQNEGI